MSPPTGSKKASAPPGAEGEALLRALGEEVRMWRAGRALSIRELSERSGVSERFLVELEGGRANVSLLRLADVARALGTSASSLVAVAEGREVRDAATSGTHGGGWAARRLVALVGLRGAGKSTIGGQVAARLGVPFIELDERIQERAGMSAGAIFDLHGVAYYRKLEREVLVALLAEGGPAVVATAGSLVTDHGSYELLRTQTTTIWLRATAEDHYARVLAQGDTRPMANRADAMNELRALLRARRALYERASEVVDTSRLGLSRTLDRVERIARRALSEADVGRR